MTRKSVGFGLLFLAACSGSSTPDTAPAPAGGPVLVQGGVNNPPVNQAPGGPAGGPGRGGPGGQNAVQPQWTRNDSAAYVRKTPASDPIIQRMYTEGMTNGQAGRLAQVLMDSIGPRLTGTPGYFRAADWVTKTYASWGIPARQQQYGTWNSWKRGVAHVDMIAPRVRSLEATMLGWSPGTGGRPLEAEVVVFPTVNSPAEFQAWLPTARGKIVLMSAPNPSCRSAQQWAQFGQPASITRNDSIRGAWATSWRNQLLHAGNPYTWTKDAGVVAVMTSSWSAYPGINKIFGSWRQLVPYFDVSCEDYNLLFRLAQNNQGPKVRVSAEAEMLGEQPMFNVIGEIRGSEKPNEYIVLSAHFDSWDGASGATDNGTGTITMLEAMRILKKVYPNPKHTILVGHWGGEEQGLNGSRGFVEDNPAIVSGVIAGFNQDNGTGRVTGIGPGPFTNAVPAMPRWLSEVPSDISGWIRIGGVSGPAGGGTDNAAFQCARSPVYGLNALSWDYSNTTWHTNRDTYDKLVIDDLKNNATLVAMLTYLADKDAGLGRPTVIDSLTNNQGVKTAVTYSCPKSTRNTAASGR